MKITSKKIWLLVGAVAMVSIGFCMVSQIIMLRKAHSTFDNYYAFRGCTKLIDQTATYGDCQLASGQTIRIVEFRGKWFLDGDLPTCWPGLCF
jgi:hypothetical protein